MTLTALRIKHLPTTDIGHGLLEQTSSKVPSSTHIGVVVVAGPIGLPLRLTLMWRRIWIHSSHRLPSANQMTSQRRRSHCLALWRRSCAAQAVCHGHRFTFPKPQPRARLKSVLDPPQAPPTPPQPSRPAFWPDHRDVAESTSHATRATPFSPPKRRKSWRISLPAMKTEMMGLLLLFVSFVKIRRLQFRRLPPPNRSAHIMALQ